MSPSVRTLLGALVPYRDQAAAWASGSFRIYSRMSAHTERPQPELFVLQTPGLSPQLQSIVMDIISPLALFNLFMSLGMNATTGTPSISTCADSIASSTVSTTNLDLSSGSLPYNASVLVPGTDGVHLRFCEPTVNIYGSRFYHTLRLGRL
ncbi:hypothetical protein EXIGLDRAFT_777868 [Exidia glandulosa HHB12029]|uniref:Uncharacterized protein n=1 Tax=Exidia glandulosa HHB12029 TaxID=1314781 RepID=A0A165CU59_EXIGL|nr:hypothetical protein EXIGLDRAFT_777868 [Exidia glandulosa HHB12029]